MCPLKADKISRRKGQASEQGVTNADGRKYYDQEAFNTAWTPAPKGKGSKGKGGGSRKEENTKADQSPRKRSRASQGKRGAQD